MHGKLYRYEQLLELQHMRTEDFVKNGTTDFFVKILCSTEEINQSHLSKSYVAYV